MPDTNKHKSFFGIILALTYLFQLTNTAPTTHYANIGSPATLTCNGGQFGCFSTYAYSSLPSRMVMIPMQSLKYQIMSGSITINNVQATDAGFYTCSSSCDQIRYDQISFYLQPTQNGQPIDTSQSFIAIPPFPQDASTTLDKYYVVVDERLDAKKSSVLTDGEIAGLVIGLFCAFLIVVAVITFLILLFRRKKQTREKVLREKSKLDTSNNDVDYSTIERDYGQEGNDNNGLSRDSTLPSTDKNLEKKRLTDHKAMNNNEINTRNIKGPNVYKPTDLNQLIDPLDLPNIDIGFNQNNPNKTSSQRSIQNNSQINIPSQSYQNQFADNTPYENQYVPRPSNRQDGSVTGSGTSSTKNSTSIRDPMLRMPPPPNRGPNKIVFPTKQGGQSNPQKQGQQQQNPRYVSNDNINLHQILAESGFLPEGSSSQSRPRTPSGSTANNLSQRQQQQQPTGDNPHLKQIFKESGFVSDKEDQGPLDDFSRRNPTGKTGYFNTRNADVPSANSSYTSKQQQQKDFDVDSDGGNVTVVSARTPNRNNNNNNNNNNDNFNNNVGSTTSGLPPQTRPQQQTNRSYQQPQQHISSNNSRNQGNMSLSQRIDSTTAQLQLPPLASLRANVGGVHFKDGATDV